MACSFPRSAALHRPLGPPQPVQFRHQRPGAVLQILQVAVAVERPAVNAARPAAPVAGLRGARTGVVGPGPADASVALVDPRSGLDADLPGPARLPAAHQASPPMACCQAPTNPASRRAQPGRSRMARAHRTPRRSGLPARSGCGRRPEGATAGASSTTGSLPGRGVGVGPRPPRTRCDLGWWPAPGLAGRSRYLLVPRATPAQFPPAGRAALGDVVLGPEQPPRARMP